MIQDLRGSYESQFKTAGVCEINEITPIWKCYKMRF
jgi:hypothetical protein